MTLKYFKTFSAALVLLFFWGGVEAYSQATYARLQADITRAGGIYHSYEFSEIEDIKAASQENAYKIKMKEMELGAHLNTIKKYLNPLTYIDYAVSKLSALENIVTAFLKGYATVREMVSSMRNKHKNNNNGENNPDSDIDNNPDNNQQ
jgi:hypothetical protein